MKKILLAAALCATSLTAVAEVAMTDSYVQLNAGYALGTKAGGNFNGKKMKNTGVVGVEAGYRFTENFRTSLSLDFVPNAKYNGSINVTGTEDGEAISQTVTGPSLKVKSYSALLNLYYDFGDFSGFTPYVTAGAGVAKNKAKITNEYNGVTVSGNKTDFAWKLGLGTRYAVNNAVDLDLRYQFVNLGKFKINAINDTNASINQLNGKLKQHQFLVGVAYKF